MNEFAPVILFVYNRPEHTALCLKALIDNKLADQSILYIFSDGAKKDASEETTKKIREVRSIIRSKQWCKEVKITESDSNRGLASSIRHGISEIIKQYGKIIVLEDDIITSPAFLTFMNNALRYYEKRKSVFSIGGYNLPFQKLNIPLDYEYDVYVSLRNDSWGWATWKDRWDQIDWKVPAFSVISRDKQMQLALNRGGDDVYRLLQKQQEGKLNIWSIQFTVAQFINHGISIIPVHSYVDNIGLDGSGENCLINQSARNCNLNNNENIKFLDVLYEDKRIINAYYSANCNKKRPLWQKIINRISRSLGGKNIFIIKKRIFK